MRRSLPAPTQLARREKSTPDRGFFMSLSEGRHAHKISTPCTVCNSGGLEGETESQSRTVALPWRKQEGTELQETESAS